MFRQVNIHSYDTKWQKIVWNWESIQQMQAFALTTVTYVIAFVPYLALRTLMQLADNKERRLPLDPQTICKSSYVNDFFAGGDTLPLAPETQRQLTEILYANGFELSKWASNTP